MNELLLYTDEIEQKLKEFFKRTREETNLIVEARYYTKHESHVACIMEVNLVDIEGEVIDSFMCTGGAWLLVLEKKFR